MASPFPIGFFEPVVTSRPMSDAGALAPVLQRIFGKTGVELIQEGSGPGLSLSGPRGQVPMPMPAMAPGGKLGKLYDYGGGRYAIRSGPSGEGLAVLNERIIAAEARLRAMPVAARLRATKKIFTSWFHEHAQHIRHTRLDTGAALPLYHEMEHVVQGGELFSAMRRHESVALEAAKHSSVGRILSRATLRPASDLSAAISGGLIRYDPSLLATTTAGETLGETVRSSYEAQRYIRGFRSAGGRTTLQENPYTWGTGVKQYEISHAGAVVSKARLGNPRLILPTAGYEYFGTLMPDLTRSVHSHRMLQVFPEQALQEAAARDAARSTYGKIHKNAIRIFGGLEGGPDAWESAVRRAHQMAASRAASVGLGTTLPTVVETAEWGDVVQAQATAFARDSYGPLGGRVGLGRMRVSEVLRVGVVGPKPGLTAAEQVRAHQLTAAIFGDAGLIGGSERMLAMANGNASRTVQIPMVRIRGTKPQVRLNPALLDLVNRIGKGKHTDPALFAGMDFEGLKGRLATGMSSDLAALSSEFGLNPGEKIVSASITGSNIRLELARDQANQRLRFNAGSRVSILSNQRKYSLTGFIAPDGGKFADIYARGGAAFTPTSDIALQTAANLATEMRGRGGLEVLARHLGQTMKTPGDLSIVESDGRLSLRLPSQHHLRHSPGYMDPTKVEGAISSAMAELGISRRTYSTRDIAQGLAENAASVPGARVTAYEIEKLLQVDEHYASVGARAGMARVGRPSVHLRLMNLRGAAQRLIFASGDSPDKVTNLYLKMMRGKMKGARRPWLAYAQAALDIRTGNVGKRKKALYDVMRLSEARRKYAGTVPESPAELADPRKLRGTAFARARPLVVVADEAAGLAGGENNMRLPFSRKPGTMGVATNAFILPTGEQVGFGTNLQFSVDLNAPPGTPGQSVQGAAVSLHRAMQASTDLEHLFRTAGESHITSMEAMLGRTGALRRAAYYPTMGNAYLQMANFGGIEVGEAGFTPNRLAKMGFTEAQIAAMKAGKRSYFVPMVVREPALDTFHYSAHKVRVLSPEDLKATRAVTDRVQMNFDDIVALHPASNPVINADLDGDAAMVSMWAQRGNAKEFAIEQEALRKMWSSPGERALRSMISEHGLDDLVEEARKVQKPGADAMSILESQARARLSQLGPMPVDEFDRMLSAEMMARAQAVKQAPQEITAAANVRWRDVTRLGQDVMRSRTQDDIWNLVSTRVRGSPDVQQSVQYLSQNKKLAAVLEHFYKNRINVGALKKGRTVELLGQTVDDVTFDSFAHSVYQRLGTTARGTEAFGKLRNTMADIIFQDMTTSQGRGGWSLAAALAGRGATPEDMRALADQAADFASHMSFIRYGVSDGAKIAARSSDAIVFGMDKSRILGYGDFWRSLGAHIEEPFQPADTVKVVPAEHFRGGAVTAAEAVDAARPSGAATAVAAEARGLTGTNYGIPERVGKVLDALQSGFRRVASNKWGRIALATGAAVSAAMLLAPSNQEIPEAMGAEGGAPMPPPPLAGGSSVPMYDPEMMETETAARVARPMQMRTHYQARSSGMSGRAFIQAGEEAYVGHQGSIVQSGIIHDESDRPMYDHQVRNHVRRLQDSRFVG